MTCTPVAVTPNLRAEGIAELTGDLQLSCQNVGDTSTATIFPNIQLIFNGIVTSKLMNAAGATEALMLIDDPGTPGAPAQVAGTNVFQGYQVGSSALQWLGIPIALPGSTTRLIRFTNLRLNASGMNIGQTATVFVSVTGTQNMTVNAQGQATIGIIEPGQSVAIRNATDTGAAGKLFQQCTTNQNNAIAADNTKSASLDFLIKFTEGFGSSYKAIGGAGANYAGFTPQNPVHPFATLNTLPTVTDFSAAGQVNPSIQYFTESGLLATSVDNSTTGTFKLVGAAAGGIGQASQGTRLFVRFANVPAGVQLFVTTSEVVVSGGGTSVLTGNIPTATATYVGQDPTAGGSGINPTTATGVTGVTSAVVPAAPGLAAVSLSGGAGSAVWEVRSASSDRTDSLAFGIVVAYVSNTTSNLPALTVTGTGTTPAVADGGFAPISTVTVASQTAPIPRFIDKPAPGTLFNIGACVTNLLFPFVTNQAGFDTGIALVNTSLDNAGSKLPFNTSTQHGTCTVYYFGSIAGGGQLPAPQTTADIPAGQSVAFNLNGGGVAGATSSAQGFQGYVIARCNFQYAHGYAFISNLGIASGRADNFAQGYIALVIPDRTRVADPMTTALAGSGEQLVH